MVKMVKKEEKKQVCIGRFLGEHGGKEAVLFVGELVVGHCAQRAEWKDVGHARARFVVDRISGYLVELFDGGVFGVANLVELRQLLRALNVENLEAHGRSASVYERRSMVTRPVKKN